MTHGLAGLIALGWIASTPAAAAGPRYRVDLSSQRAAAETFPVAHAGHEVCADPPGGDGPFAVAVVVYGRRFGVSAWGHTSLRFLSCRAGQVEDVEFEYYRFGKGTGVQLPARHPGEDFAHDPATRRAARGHLYLLSNEHPVDSGHFARELEKNREIWEAWLDLPGDEIALLLRRLEDREARQLERFRARAPLAEGRYVGLGRNCTVPVREAMALVEDTDDEIAPGVFPFAVLRRLEARDDTTLVLHPSPHALRRMVDAAGGVAAWAEARERDGAAWSPRLRPLLRSELRPDDRFWMRRYAARSARPAALAPADAVSDARD